MNVFQGIRKRPQTSCASAQCRLLLKIQTHQQDILHKAFFHDQVQEKERGSSSGGVVSVNGLCALKIGG